MQKEGNIKQTWSKEHSSLFSGVSRGGLVKRSLVSTRLIYWLGMDKQYVNWIDDQ